jgi:site-specific DNA-methyltransferase (adenine-specific)
MSRKIHHGDCREVMATLDAASVDAIVSDPPYGLSFMGKGWDHGVPGVEFWAEALRVAKPGAHLLAFGGTRTYHRLACAIEDAGWEIRDCVMWVYGSGFPKSHDVSKAIDKAAGAEREVVGETKRGAQSASTGRYGAWGDGITPTAPATAAARQWSGWGTALKPAWEPIIVARKPLVGTVAENVLTHGTGAINVDGCRVGIASGDQKSEGGRKLARHQETNGFDGGWKSKTTNLDDGLGRWPANLIHDGSEEVVGLFPATSARNGGNTGTDSGGVYSGTWGNAETQQYRDSGSAARFFYCAKASKADREEGLASHPERDTSLKYNRGDGFAGRTLVDGEWVNTDKANRTRPRNHHPTVKPTDLMRYLCRLVTPPGGVVLDPFTGSGSTGKAATLEGFRFIGIEREAEYVEIARARIAAVAAGAGPLFA